MANGDSGLAIRSLDVVFRSLDSGRFRRHCFGRFDDSTDFP